MNIARTMGLAAAALIYSSSISGQTTGDSIVTPRVPPDIQVPAGNVAYLKGQATGTQNYVCLPAAESVAWKFQAPQATLFATLKIWNVDIRQQITTHFLSMNPDENGMPRPTWQSSVDTSSVWAKAIASSSDPAYVAAGAIPWLLLEVTGREPGPMGGTALTSTTFIQRVNTAGGVTPVGGCSTPVDIGKISFVPYTTDYLFFRAAGR